MSSIKYSSQQIQELENNIYVASATSKYISFSNEFKLLCIEQDKQWVYHGDIFYSCGFPDYIVHSDIPKRSLWRWRRQVRQWWEEVLVWKKKWRPKVEKVDFWKMNLAEQNEYLKTENTYLRELHKQKYAHSKLIASWNTKDQREQ